MAQTLIRSLVVMVLFVASINAQTKREVGSPSASVTERAQRLEPYFAAAAQRYRIDARVLRILCFMESRFRLDAVSPKGARGPMQFMPDTARRYGVVNPHDPRQAIEAAAHYLRDLLNRFGGRIDLAFAAYNAGEGTVQSFLTGRPLVLPTGKIINPHRRITDGIPPYSETRDYVKLGLALLRSSPRLSPTQPLIPRSVVRTAQRDFTVDTSVSSNVADKSPFATTSFIEVP